MLAQKRKLEGKSKQIVTELQSKLDALHQRFDHKEQSLNLKIEQLQKQLEKDPQQQVIFDLETGDLKRGIERKDR